MRNCCVRVLVGAFFIFLSGCATYSTNHVDQDNDQVDLYLSTLDDKHFVWCELDLEACRQDYEKWKLTPRGRTIIEEYEKGDTGQTYNTHHVPNVFRTQFVDESQLEEEAGRDADMMGKSNPSINQPKDLLQEKIPLVLTILGPEVPSYLGAHPEELPPP